MLRYIVNIYTIYFKEELEDAKSVNRRRTDNTMSQRIKEHNDLQNTTQKTKYRVTRPPPPKKDKNKNKKNTTQTTEVEIQYCNQSIRYDKV